jgi:hypothetical protein
VDEKHLREYYVPNCCGVIITTNYKINGIYLPTDDRRHFVAWSDARQEDFPPSYWEDIWGWYHDGGFAHVAAYLAELDLSDFDPKAPPRKTPAFWAIVDASRAPEEGELADVLDKMGNPGAVTLQGILRAIDEWLGIKEWSSESQAQGALREAQGAIQQDAIREFREWLSDRKNRRAIPHRLEQCGYVPVRNDAAKDGLWKIGGSRQVVYAKAELTGSQRIAAAQKLCGR